MGLWDGILAPRMWVEVVRHSGRTLQSPLIEAFTISLIPILQLYFDIHGHMVDYKWKIVKTLK